MLFPILLLAVQAQSPLAVRADTTHPVHDALHYNIQVVIGDTSSHIVGQVETTWRLTSVDPVRVELDTALRVIRVLTDGKEATRLSRTMYSRDSGSVWIPTEKAPGESLETMIRYRGYVSNGLVIRDRAGGGRTAFADNWPDRAHYWLPVQDVPSDKATVAFHVEVPAGLQAIANGVLDRVDSLPRGRTVWHYHTDSPIPVYTMVIGVARFARTPMPDAACSVKCVPLAIWTYPADSAWAVEGPFKRAGEILEYFSSLIGPFPFERLTHVESTTMFGGMENSTAIFYDERAYANRGLSETTVAHETAHQWFGDAVTESDWHHLWLSEGFATYFGSLWLEHAYGADRFRQSMREAAASVFSSRVSNRPILDSATTDLMGLLNNNNYPKAAWVLHSLRGILGDSTFFSGIREYYRQYRDSTVFSSDFAAIMSRVAGQDLDWYFRQALTQPGYPELKLTWQRAHGKTRLIVDQVQDSSWGVFKVPGLVILADGKPIRVNLEGRHTEADLDLDRVPSHVEVDPEGWWLVKVGETR